MERVGVGVEVEQAGLLGADEARVRPTECLEDPAGDRVISAHRHWSAAGRVAPRRSSPQSRARVEGRPCLDSDLVPWRELSAPSLEGLVATLATCPIRCARGRVGEVAASNPVCAGVGPGEDRMAFTGRILERGCSLTGADSRCRAPRIHLE